MIPELNWKFKKKIIVFLLIYLKEYNLYKDFIYKFYFERK